MSWTHRFRATCLCLVRGRPCVVIATALAITMVMHIILLTVLVNRQNLLWNIEIATNLAPNQLLHSGRQDNNRASILKNALTQINVDSKHANQNYLKQGWDSRHARQLGTHRTDVTMNNHDRMNIHDSSSFLVSVAQRRQVRRIGYIKMRHNPKGDIDVSRKHSEGQNGELAGGSLWSAEKDMSLEGFMPIKPVLPSVDGDKIV